MVTINRFQQAFPERGVNPPSLPGETAFQGTDLVNLRRSQLHNIARAWGIHVDPNLTKEEVLHPLIDAERRGVFNNPPESPYYWEMAQRDPDMPLQPLQTPFPDTPKKRPGERLPGGAGFKQLQQTCKALKINCVGMSVQEMRDAINKVVNGESEGEVRSEGGGEGLEGQDRQVGETLGPLVEKGSIPIEG